MASGAPPAWRAEARAISDRLRSRSPLPALVVPRPATPWDAALQARIQALGAPAAVRSGLLLWNDDLAGSHALSQAIEGPAGAYWHGLMHRREGDLDNSAYWFRRAGAHPAFASVYEAAVREAGDPLRAALERAGRWDPFAFIDWCRSPGTLEAGLRRVQAAEIEALLAYSAAEGAVGHGALASEDRAGGV